MTPHRVFDVPEVLSSHVVPSEEVRIVPEVPTTTNVLFANATPQRSFDVPEVLDVQDAPSGAGHKDSHFHSFYLYLKISPAIACLHHQTLFEGDPQLLQEDFLRN